jgi:SAM-dependent methyltransferase
LCREWAPTEFGFDLGDDGHSQDVTLHVEVPRVFDQPSLWRIEAARALGLDVDHMIAAMSPGPAFPAALRSLQAALTPQPNVIVDLGAGTGGVSEWMRLSTGATVYAIEPEDGARRAARLAFPHLHVLAGRADLTSLPGGCADAIVMSGVTSLMSDLEPAIAEIDRLLTTSGRLAIADLFSSTTKTWCSGPNTFRSIEDLTRTLPESGFISASVGCGDPVPDPNWAAAAQAVDDWIDAHCANRLGYEVWIADRRHLRDHVRSGNVIGGCLVAQRSSSAI